MGEQEQPSEATLAQVKKIIQQLSPEDRRQVLLFLARFPDMRAQISSLASMIESFEKAKMIRSFGNSTHQYPFDLLEAKNLVSAQIYGKEILRVIFLQDNFVEGSLSAKAHLMPGILDHFKQSYLSNMREKEQESNKNSDYTDVEMILGEALLKKIINGQVRYIGEQISLFLPRMVAEMLDLTIKTQETKGINKLMAWRGNQKSEPHLRISKEKLDQIRRLISSELGIQRGGARPRKSKSPWDAKKSMQFYQTVESLPSISKKPIWVYAQEQLRDNDYTADTIQWLGQNPAFADAPADLLNEAASIWRSYDEDWASLPPEHKPQAFSFRHACHKLGIAPLAYNTLRKRYYEGKKACNEKA